MAQQAIIESTIIDHSITHTYKHLHHVARHPAGMSHGIHMICMSHGTHMIQVNQGMQMIRTIMAHI